MKQLRCTSLDGSGSRMFHTGGIYPTRNPVNRTVEVTDDLGHKRVMLIEDKKARFCIGHVSKGNFKWLIDGPYYAHFEEEVWPGVPYADAR